MSGKRTLRSDVDPDPRASRRSVRGIRRGLTSERELREQLLHGTLDHAARARLARLLGARGHPTFTRSEAEELFLALLREGDVVIPLCNVDRHGYEIDFLWPDHRLAVEIDGWWVHSSRDAFQRDRRKSADLWQRGGITVIRLTWLDITRDRTATVVRIGQLLTSASTG